jgi:N-acetylmuramoyl-L-alanine amidase
MRCCTKNHKHCTIIKVYLASWFLFLSLSIYASTENDKLPGSNDGWVVVIDAGHGGKDPGTVGRRSKEKDLTLAIALKTGKYIEDKLPGVKVIYTRKTDEFVELYKRAEIANKAKADLFISIHINGSPDSRAKGSECYAMGIHKDEGNLEVAMKENAVITLEDDYSSRYMGYDPKSSESFITFSLIQNLYLEQSLSFASFIQRQFKERVGLRDRGVKQAGFIVLWQTTMPSVLVEAGFSSNPEEEKFLMSSEGQDYIASAIFRAFRSYKDAIDKKSEFSTIKSNTPDAASQSDAIDFRVQIVTSTLQREINSETFKGLENISEIKSGRYFKYATGSFKSYSEAATYRQTIKNLFPDAFVIAVESGNIVPLQEAIESTKKD